MIGVSGIRAGRLSGSVTSVQALEEGLQDQDRASEWFMQDNAPIHTAKLSTEWLESHGVATITWPPYSPYLNPIEHLW